jgi:hypothetical protein
MKRSGIVIVLGIAWLAMLGTTWAQPADDAEQNEPDLPRVAFADCPAEVQKTLQRESLGATLNGLFEDTDDGQKVYRAEVTFERRNYEIVIAIDGTLLEKVLVEEDDDEMVRVDFADCPEGVQRLLKREVGDNTIVAIARLIGVTPAVYVADARLDEKDYVVKVSEDGALLSKILASDHADEDASEKEEVEVVVIDEHKSRKRVDLKIRGKSFEIKVVDGGISISIASDDEDESDANDDKDD